MTTDSVGIVILTFNNFDDTFACIQSVNKSKYQNKLILIVDNGSNKSYVKLLRDSIKDMNSVELLELKKNYGFSKGNNFGINLLRKKNIKHIFLLNNDTLIEADCIDHIIKRVANETACGIISPKIRDYNKKHIIQIAGSYKRLFDFKHRGKNQEDLGQFDKAELIGFSSGCAMFITDRAIKQIGLLDERFFFGCEDKEYSFRCKKAKLEIWYEPKAVVYHKKGESRKKLPQTNKLYLGYLSQLLFYKITRTRFKWLGLYFLYAIYLILIFPFRLAIIHGINKNYFNCLFASWNALIKAFFAKKAFPKS